MARPGASNLPVVLLYHGVARAGGIGTLRAEDFRNQLHFLHRHFEVVHPDEAGTPKPRVRRPRVVLTFDDGFLNNAAIAAPMLREFNIPAAFFVCSRHAEPGEYLWFAYLRALELEYDGDWLRFRDERLDMRGAARRMSMTRLRELLLGLRPHPAAMYTAIQSELPRLEDFVRPQVIADRYAGMSAGHVRELASDPLFTIGAHTVDHPFLTRCVADEMSRQITDNLEWIKDATGQPCKTIAYPLGDYDETVIGVSASAGIQRGFAVQPANSGDRVFHIPRIGVHSSSTDILGIKARWGNTLRAVRAPVG